jgi:predicted DNA-binding protein with PD1-like motif
MKIFSKRLTSGMDLKKEVIALISEKKIKAGIVLSSVGSLSQIHLRFANSQAGHLQKGHFEIIHLNGTIAENGVHLHLAVANEQGALLGGHLLDGNLIHTTCEFVIGELDDVIFKRSQDPQTGYLELMIQ